MKTKIFTLSILISMNIFSNKSFAQGYQIAREVKGIMYGEEADYSGMAASGGSGSGGLGVGVGSYMPKPIVKVTDSVVFDAFTFHPEWKNALVIVDWTGSMYQYGAQVLRWHKLNKESGDPIVKHMILFNDGNDKLHPNQEKPIGSTGGIYPVDPNDVDDLLKNIESAVDNGDGGEIEENNLEAVVEGIKMYDDYDCIIMIADSKSWVRDMALLDQINKPVNVILCDKGGYATDYLKIASKTGGSVYAEKDHVDFSDKLMASLHEIVFNGKTYKLN